VPEVDATSTVVDVEVDAISTASIICFQTTTVKYGTFHTVFP
jgi:hypothetical protein